MGVVCFGRGTSYSSRSSLIQINVVGEWNMGHHKSGRWFKKSGIWNILALVIGSIGLGMLLAMLIPFWVWIVVVGISLIAYAVWFYNIK